MNKDEKRKRYAKQDIILDFGLIIVFISLGFCVYLESRNEINMYLGLIFISCMLVVPILSIIRESKNL